MSKSQPERHSQGKRNNSSLDCVDLGVGVDNWLRSEANSVDCPTNTKPQLGQLADEIRCLFRQNTATGIFEKLGRDISLTEYQSNGKFYASLQNWMARWNEVGVMEAKILQYAKDSVEAEASPSASIGGFDVSSIYLISRTRG